MSSTYLIKANEVVTKLLELVNNKDVDTPNVLNKFLKETLISDVADRIGEIKNWNETTPIKEEGMEALITVIEKFMWSGYADKCIEKIKTSEQSTSCCYVNEPYSERTFGWSLNPCFYMCKDCVDDDNDMRFLCIDCFKNSIHCQHNYSIIKEKLAAYCCCGEIGTWKTNWVCSTHLGLPIQSPLPKDIENKVCVVIQAIISIIDGLVSQHYLTDFVNYNQEEHQDVCLVIHFNDNIKFQPLYELLKSQLNISEDIMKQYQKSAIQESLITIKAPKMLCDTIIRKLNSVEEGNYLKCKIGIFSAEILLVPHVLYLEFSCTLMKFLQKILKYGSQFRRIFTVALTEKTAFAPKSLSINILCNYFKSIDNCFLLRAFRKLCMKIIILGSMKEFTNKMLLAKRIVEFQENFTKGLLLSKFFKILFYTPQLFFTLIAEDDALKTVMERLTVRTEEVDLKDLNSIIYENIRVSSELETLLSLRPKQWTIKLREGFLTGLTYFIRVLISYQYLEFETGREKCNLNHLIAARKLYYIKSKYLYRTLISCCSSLLEWCESDDIVLEKAWEITLNIFNEKFIVKDPEILVKVLDYQASYAPYDSTQQTVPIWLLFHRFLIGFYLIKIEKKQKVNLDVSHLFDPIMRIQVTRAVVDAGMWRWNINQDLKAYIKDSVIYHWDIRLFQILGASTDSNQFMIQLLGKYNLIEWINNPNFEKALDDEKNRKTIIIAENFLLLLIMILTERFKKEVGYNVTEEDHIRNCILYELSLEPRNYSYINYEILEKLPEKIYNLKGIEKLVDVNEQGLCVPKLEVWSHIHPINYFYSKSKMLRTKESQLLRLRKTGKPQFFPPPCIPQLKQFFMPIVNVFQCDITLHLITTVLKRSIKPRSRNYSEKQLEYVLYLIGYALQEEESGGYPNLVFSQRAMKWNFLEYLEKLLKEHEDKETKELLQWTIAKFKLIVGVHTTVMTNEDAPVKVVGRDHKKKLANYREKMLREMKDNQFKFIKKCTQIEKDISVEELHENEESTDVIGTTCVCCHVIEKNCATSMMLVGFIQRSNVLSSTRKNICDKPNSLLLPFDFGQSFYINSCGHAMHYTCFESFFRELMNDLSNEDVPSFDKYTEYRCPLCKFLGNSKLPLLPRSTGKYQNHDLIDSGELKMVFENFMTKEIRFTDPFQIWKVISYTIHVEETVLRYLEKPLLNHLTFGQKKSLEVLVEIARYFPLACTTSELDTQTLNNVMGEISQKPISKFHDIDLFSLTLAMIFSGNNIFDSEQSQTLLTLCEVQMQLGFSISNLDEAHMNNDEVFWKSMQDFSIPFLRCCVLLKSFLSSQPISVELTKYGGDTFENMCQYLGLPTTRESFLRREDIKIIRSPGGYNPLRINQLIELPNDECALISLKHSIEGSLYCKEREEAIPAICLVCGEVFCLGTNCQVFENGRFYRPEIYHFNKCGNAINLNLTNCNVKIGTRLDNIGCITQLYVNKVNSWIFGTIGESPTFLSNKTYKQLNTMWLSHDLYQELSRICHKFNNDD